MQNMVVDNPAEHRFELALEGELHHQVLGRAWARVGIDPHAHV